MSGFAKMQVEHTALQVRARVPSKKEVGKVISAVYSTRESDLMAPASPKVIAVKPESVLIEWPISTLNEVDEVGFFIRLMDADDFKKVFGHKYISQLTSEWTMVNTKEKFVVNPKGRYGSMGKGFPKG